MFRIACVLIVLTAGGCAKEEHIPLYSSMPPADAMRVLAERSRNIHAVSGEGLITLTHGAGDTVRLDAAVVLQPPEKARVRAWKFGSAVFDMTLTPEGLWLIAPDDSKRREEIRAAGNNIGKLTREWLDLMGRLFEKTDIAVEENGAFLVVKQQRAEGMSLTCKVERKTLTPREYILRDSGGVARFTLTLKQYVEVGGTVWPKEISAKSSSGEILIELREVEINGEIPPSAFKPPSRAEKLP